MNREVCYYLYGGHGSARTLTNEAGRITDRYSYDAYGNLLEKEGNTENEFLYTGEQYNANTGLYYLCARYMNPSTGTFISMDSYQGSVYDPVSLHKYLYANANPVMYTDPSGYATDKNLAETAVAATIAVMLASSVALHNQAMLNIFSTLRKNMADAVMSLPCSVSVTDWKNVILGFPAQEFDTKWLITIPMALISWQLFEAIYATEEDTNNLPGVPAEEQEEKDKVESIPAEEQSGVKVYSDYITDNRVPLDNETILGNGTFQKTKIRVKGATVYKKGNRYYYRDTFHTGESAHLEVFDKSGNHLGEADPKTGEIRPGTVDSSKKLNVR